MLKGVAAVKAEILGKRIDAYMKIAIIRKIEVFEIANLQSRKVIKR